VIQQLSKRALLTAALMVGLPMAAAAQAGGAGSQAEVEGLLREMQQVHTQLEGLQQQALQDPQLSAAQEELGEEIKVAMERIDPQMEQRLSRIEALEGEAASAHQAGNGERLQELMAEAQQIQQHFMNVQQQALEQPQIATKVDAFQTRLERRMVEMNPEAEGLINRFRELETRLMALMGG
jgi:chromosome segregation ATPase